MIAFPLQIRSNPLLLHLLLKALQGLFEGFIITNLNISQQNHILSGFRPETALLRNLSVNLPDFLCDVHMYVSAQSVDYLDLAQNCSFPPWKHDSFRPETVLV